MPRERRISLCLMLVCSGISILWGFSLDRHQPGGAMGFPGVYYGTRCLIQHCDPYNVEELQKLYFAERAESPPESIQRQQSLTLYVNLPSTFLFVAPLALLPFWLAHDLWLILIIGSFLLASCLMWSLGASRAPNVSLFLVCIFLINAEEIFAGGNTAGLVVSLCAVAVWCLLQDRFVLGGILCFAVSLAIKPHDGGLIWLYFLLAGGSYRKRALQAMAITIALALTAILWVSAVAPLWMPEMRSNLAAISMHGGINDPGPTSIGMGIPGMVIDLQTVFSVFRDNPLFYNAATYLVCGVLLLIWSLKALRSQFSTPNAWFAIASISALTMLVTYHRPYDAKLLLLTIPACCILWVEGGRLGWLALLISTAGAVFIGDVPLAILVILTEHLHVPPTGTAEKLLTVVLARPVPLILLTIAIFYLWVYVRRAPSRLETMPHGSAVQTHVTDASV